MLNNLSFSVAISTFNRNEDLRRCLEALRGQGYKDFAVVIANGGEPGGVNRVCEEFKDLRIKVVNQQERGRVDGLNLGWMNSPTDIVCLIDDDLVPEPEWLANIRASFLADERIGGVTGPTIIPPERRANRDLMFFLVEANARGNIILRIFAKLYLAVVLENKIHQVGRILKSGFFTPGSNFPPCRELPAALEVDYLEACHMCFRRRLFEELGGFDTAYTGTGEWSEPDFSFRVRQKGWRLVFNPQAATYHYISRGGVFQARTNSYERSRNFIRFYRRWVKPNTPEKFFRFSANLLFINFYWCYKFLQTGNFDWLRGIAGTFGGLLKDKNA